MEVFRDIEGYEGMYQVSNFGNVKSLNYHRSGEEKLLKAATNCWGYPYAVLCKNGKTKNYSIHRLVAEAFIDNPDNLPQVNHKDEDKTNNNVDNLEWCTREYNCNYGTRNNRMAETKKGKPHPWVAKALSISVDMLSKQGEFIRQFPSAMEAERWLRNNGFPSADNSHIIMCCKGKQKIAYSHKWQYTKELPN